MDNHPPQTIHLSSTCPRILISSTQSGSGKTSISLGLIAAYRERGLRVQTFKVGPDFLDPTYLAKASNRPCYNLDGWMTNRDYVCSLFAEATRDVDLAIIEGAMGLFDGAYPDSLEGTSAQIAAWLAAPVLMIVNTHGLSGTLAPLVRGFVGFAPGVEIAGVVANHCGSRLHANLLAKALHTAELPPLLGAVQRGALMHLPSRHLGLVTADDQIFKPAVLDNLGQAVCESIDLDGLFARAKQTQSIHAKRLEKNPKTIVRVGLARDSAFHFYYQDNLDALERSGVSWQVFSPMRDERLPPNLDAVYLGGGYPEEHAEALSENHGMLEELRSFARAGKTIYAECGGLIYLTQKIETIDGRTFPLADIIPVGSVMSNTRKRLAYCEVTFLRDTFLGKTGTCLRGHEYHYSSLDTDPLSRPGWLGAYRLKSRQQQDTRVEGFQHQSILASYVHLQIASHPEAADWFVQHCINQRKSTHQSTTHENRKVAS